MGIHGGARRGRTADLLHAMQALYQLSYGPLKNAKYSKTDSDASRTTTDQDTRLLAQLPAQPLPIEGSSWVGLAARRHIGVACNVANGWKDCSKPATDLGQDRILDVCIGNLIAAFQFDADGKIIAVRPAPKR